MFTLKLASNRAVHTTAHQSMRPATVLGLQTIWADVFHGKLGCEAQKTPLGLCIRLLSCSSCCRCPALLLLWSLLHFYHSATVQSLHALDKFTTLFEKQYNIFISNMYNNILKSSSSMGSILQKINLKSVRHKQFITYSSIHNTKQGARLCVCVCV